MSPDQKTVALVTGGASGIGLALAREIGTRVDAIVIADVDGASLETASEHLQDLDVAVHPHQVDLRNAQQVDELAAACRGLGAVTLACFNAGVVSSGQELWRTPADTVRFVLDCNVVGVTNSIRSIVPILVEQSLPSAVVITASMAALVTTPYAGVYAASKAATVALAKALRAELISVAPHVQVLVCCPGVVQTNLLRTSARSNPDLMSDEIVEAGHETLNKIGMPAAEQARRILTAVDEKRFWVLPPQEDPLVGLLSAELDPLE